MSVLIRSWAVVFFFSSALAHSEPKAPFDSPELFLPTSPVDVKCSLSVGSTTIDYGVLSRWQLEGLGMNKFTPGTRLLTVNATCPSSRRIIISVAGEQAESGGFRYGQFGVLELRLLNAQLDGKDVDITSLTSDQGLSAGTTLPILLGPGQRLMPVKTGSATGGKALTLQIEIKPILVDKGARVSSRQKHETRLRFELVD